MNESIKVAIEVGTSKVCVLVTKCKGPNNPLNILGCGLVKSSGVRKGEIVNMNLAVESLRQAIHLAQEKTGYPIDSAWVAITGGHVRGFITRTAIEFHHEKREVESRDLDELEERVKDLTDSMEEEKIHTILMKYILDGNDHVENPLGMLGRRLEADYHIISGVATRLQNTIRCVKEAGIEVEDMVASSLASAYAALSERDKQLGVLLLDIGGGVTDYIAFLGGEIYSSGVLAVGGDHVTYDISFGLSISDSKAEQVKCQDSSCWLENSNEEKTLIIKPADGYAGREVRQSCLDLIVSARMRELLQLIRKRVEKDIPLELLRAGVVITGGGSLIRGLQPLAENVFERQVSIVNAIPNSGSRSYYSDPRLTTPIGVAKFAHWHSESANRAGWLHQLKNIFAIWK